MSKSRLPDGSARTIASYEDYADSYARLVSDTPSSRDAAALRRLAESWRRDAFVARLEATGFAVEWDEFSTDCDGDDWVTFLARRPS